jgi:hypothetical protein
MKFSSRFIVRPNENFNGLSYGDWASNWWNWFVSDQTQFGSVYFLRGNTDKEHAIVMKGNNSPIVYSDTAIFFPIICTITSRLLFPDASTQTMRRKGSTARQKNPLVLSATINHTTIPNLRSYYAESPEFILEVPKSSKQRLAFDPPLRVGKSPAVSAGYWLLLKPLPPGTYTIKFKGIHEDGFVSSGNYTVKVLQYPKNRIF